MTAANPDSRDSEQGPVELRGRYMVTPVPKILGNFTFGGGKRWIPQRCLFEPKDRVALDNARRLVADLIHQIFVLTTEAIMSRNSIFNFQEHSELNKMGVTGQKLGLEVKKFMTGRRSIWWMTGISIACYGN
jgi:hypothetical protein